MANAAAASNGADEDDIPSFISLFDHTEEDSVCDFGDIILVADDGFHPILKIRVSSCILANTSTYFKALFSRKYAEGQSSASSGPREVILKEKPSALKSLCYVLHHKDPAKSAHAMKLQWGDSDLYDLAVIADKFDCVDAIQLQTETLFSRYGDIKTCEDEFRLTASACLLDSVKYFREYTKYLVQHFCPIAKRNIDDHLQPYLPNDLRTSINAQIAVVRERLTREISELNNQFIAACHVLGKDAGTIHGFMETLQNALIWPLDFQWHTLDGILSRLEGVEIPVLSAEKVVSRSRRGSDASYTSEVTYDQHGWGSMRRSKRRITEPVNAPTDRDVRERVTRVRQLCVGVCLDCIRDRSCRKPHRYRWEKRPWAPVYLDSDAGSEADGEMEYDVYKSVEQPTYWEDAW